MITGTKFWVETLRPTSDIDKVVRYLYNLENSGLGGELSIGRGIIISRMILNEVEPCKLKRILFFARGPGDMCYKKIQVAEEYGNLLKREGIAVDFITFCRNENCGCDWKMVLDAFVAAANNNNNKSHIKHVRPGSSTRVSHVLSSTPEIIPFALLEEKDNKKAKDPEGKLLCQRKNQVAAAANDDENVRVHEEWDDDDEVYLTTPWNLTIDLKHYHQIMIW
ncbi:26S proteasome non-ATPase regulatory subunit 4 homolog [Rutidosis leptorrhynchoides]|uniref:26S proteasome non-ATPase regulatory subunit 4 homolog n=1 Tax=Rutidosis leptorrhynchoides TaxID=125765 RepID=UPI003A99F635